MLIKDKSIIGELVSYDLTTKEWKIKTKLGFVRCFENKFILIKNDSLFHSDDVFTIRKEGKMTIYEVIYLL